MGRAVDERTCSFGHSPCEPAPDRAILRSVDKGGHVEKLWTSVGRAAWLAKPLENAPRQDGAARDESGEIPECRRAGVEEISGFVGSVDAAGRDEIETIAESRARAADVVERR